MEFTEQMQGLVIEKAAELLVDQIRDDEAFESVNARMSKRADALFADYVEKSLKDRLDAVIEDAFTRTYQRVNAWGQPEGVATSIAAELEKVTRNYWEQTVDPKGKPVERNNYSTQMSRAEYVMLQAAGEDFAKLLKQNAINVTAALKDGLRAEMRRHVDATLGELFHVRSAEDQAEGRAK